MDAITDFLTVIGVQGVCSEGIQETPRGLPRLKGVCYGRIQVTTQWAPRFEAGSHAGFGLISYGQAWLHLPDVAEPLHLLNGDFFLLAPGREYSLSTGGSGAPSAIIAGRFSFD